MMRWAALIAVVAVLMSCSKGDDRPSPAEFARELADAVTADGMYTHLDKLQEIADANDGNRGQGAAGLAASVDYVAQFLRDKGFDVETPEYERLDRMEGGDPKLTVNGRDHHVDQASLLISTPPGGLKAITLRPGKPAGCRASDYDGVSVKGAISVVDDTGCSVVDKQNVAVGEGAVGLLIVSEEGRSGLFPPGYYRGLTVPVGIIDTATNAALRRTTARVALVLDSKPVLAKGRNVLAQTKTGDTSNVVMAGAHLDSSAASPGVNDNGSGVAALLETASALGSQPRTTNAVRFAFWGSEENGLAGATSYLRELSAEQLSQIALYLDFDMIGSSNAGYFTYDGDQSAQPNPDIPAHAVPEGSAGIERTLAGYLYSAGVRPADMPLSRITDYNAFLSVGVPIGGLTAGSSQRKSEAQARLWGGHAGIAFDPNYRTRRDTVDNINRDALAVMGSAAAFAVATYAQSIDGVNGVPAQEQRQRGAR
ncbi:M28 family peptidase [Mycolicibacterium elephantis]|uniref:M28 family peptidase n=1 Tax=Mycolicibacterium elephantis TaxID=81858 RepID=UPI003A8C0075